MYHHLLNLGFQDMLAWVKKRRRTIRREDLISFLCGKAPPHRSSRANPRLAMVAPSRANSPAETGSSVEADLQPFREAIALHGEAQGSTTACVWTVCGYAGYLKSCVLVCVRFKVLNQQKYDRRVGKSPGSPDSDVFA